ncbi:hypothetical protein Tco_1265646 [Tanacetum coccineum]
MLDEMEGGFRSLCDRRIPLKIKGKFYRAAIRPTMLYGLECWAITKALANKVEVAELRMIRWTCGKTMVDMIPNEVFRGELDVDSIIDKMREERLRWFRHVKRRPQTALVRRMKALVVEGSRRRGRPKLRWEDRLKMDMKELRLSEDMTSDRNAWRDRIRISGLMVCFGFVSLSILEHHPYAHVHWPEVLWKQAVSLLPGLSWRLFDENPASGSAVGVVPREDASGSNIDIRSEQRQTLRVSEPPVSSEHDLPTHFSSVRSLKQRGSLQSMRNAIVPHVTSENRGVFFRSGDYPRVDVRVAIVVVRDSLPSLKDLVLSLASFVAFLLNMYALLYQWID